MRNLFAKAFGTQKLDVGADLGTIVGVGLGIIVGAGLGTQFQYPPLTEQQNPPSSEITEQQYPPYSQPRSHQKNVEIGTLEKWLVERLGQGGFCRKVIGDSINFVPKPAPTLGFMSRYHS
ncbi:MAG: hypothetical protein RIE73_18745 [Coleofasciculus sp. C1-SOL-03]|uniref:hypothetical protein n=1 Tax=Coleofasciculus sp. C1-SOL-03 TaxID=3069522 RepID=UPI0032F36B48